MSYFRVLSIIVAVSCLLAVSPCLYAQEHRWDIEVTLTKNQYVQHEPIWLDITITNAASDTQRTDGLSAPNHRQFLSDLKDSSGLSLRYTGVHFDFAPSPGELLLNQGEQDYGSFDVLRLFGIADPDSGSFLMSTRFPYIPSGSYTVQVYYEDAASVELPFLVVEPSGEAKEMLNLIKQANADWKQHNLSATSLKFREAVDRFPDGPYAATCYYLSMLFSEQVWRNSDTIVRTNMMRAILTKYPNSGDARDWIRAIARGIDSQAEKKFLDELAEAYPNTRCAKYVEVVQERLDSQKAGE